MTPAEPVDVDEQDAVGRGGGDPVTEGDRPHDSGIVEHLVGEDEDDEDEKQGEVNAKTRARDRDREAKGGMEAAETDEAMAQGSTNASHGGVSDDSTVFSGRYHGR